MLRTQTWAIIFLPIVCAPDPIAPSDWQPAGGPPGAYVRSFAADGQKVYFATGGGGVLASDDAGEHWHASNQHLSSHDLMSIAAMGVSLFVASDENVFRSSDHGASWEACGTELAGKYTKTLLVTDGLLFAGRIEQDPHLPVRPEALEATEEVGREPAVDQGGGLGADGLGETGLDGTRLGEAQENQEDRFHGKRGN